MVGPYEREVKKFLKAATYLQDEDGLMVTHLRMLAKSLDAQVEEDGGVQSALANTFGVTLRSLQARKPKVLYTEPADDDEDLEFS